MISRAAERVDGLLPDAEWLARRGVDILNPDPEQLRRYHVDMRLWELACVLAEALAEAEAIEARDRYKERDWTQYATADPTIPARH